MVTMPWGVRSEKVVRSSRPVTTTLRPISLALLFGCLISGVASHHTMMCYRPVPYFSGSSWGEVAATNLLGLGTDRIDPNSNGIYHIWANLRRDMTFAYNSPTLGFNFTLYPLYYSNGNHMNGWYRFKIMMWGYRNYYPYNMYGTHIISYFLWAHYEFVGEWLTDDQFQPIHDPRFKDCPKNDATRYMGISCGGAYPTQPSVSNTIRFAANANGTNYQPWNFTRIHNPPSGHPNNLTTMNYYFRLSAQTCDTVNRDSPFRPNIKSGILFSIKVLLHNAWDHPTYPVNDGNGAWLVHEVMYEVKDPGAILAGADPLDLAEEVNCEKVEIKEGDNRTSSSSNTKFSWPWFAKSFHARSFVTDEMSYKNDWNVNREYGCQANLFAGRCKHNLNRKITYDNLVESRVLTNQNIAKPDVSYMCNNNVSKHVPPPMIARPTMYYTDFLANPSANFMEKCANEDICTRKVTPIDVKTDTTNPILDYDEQRGLHVKQINNVWNLRKGHGILMVILTVFLIPVNAFIARYFKESFMTQRIFFARIWYAIHSHVSGWIFAFTFAGSTVALVSTSRGALGKSLTKAAKIHHTLAYVSYAILVLVLFSSGLRSYDEGGRIFTVCCHWALGTLLYLLNVGALVTSMYIPASPIALIDNSMTIEQLKEFNLPSGLDLSFVLIIGWLVFDVLAHIIMTIGIIVSDKKMQVIRGRLYCPTPIPVIREDQPASSDGSAFRAIVLFIYISVSIFVTAGLCYVITFESSPDGRGYGPMSCTHSIAHGVFESRLPKMKTECNY